MPGYREKEEPHRAVHRHGIAALLHRQDGNQSETLQNLRAMEEASTTVLERLEEIASSAERQNQWGCAASVR